MEWSTDKTKLSQIIGREMKRFAETDKTTVVIPVIIKPIQVQITFASILVEISHVTITVEGTVRNV